MRRGDARGLAVSLHQFPRIVKRKPRVHFVFKECGIGRPLQERLRPRHGWNPGDAGDGCGGDPQAECRQNSMVQPACVLSEGNQRDGRQKADDGQAGNQIQNRASGVGSKRGFMTPDNPHRIKPKHSQRGERIGRRKRNEFDGDECFDQERGNDGDEDSPARRNPEGQQRKMPAG